MELNSIIIADVREGLARLPDASVHCVVTSPPYWGLRDYKIPPSVWGRDPACAHKWSMTRRTPQSGGTGAASVKQVSNGGTQGGVQRPIEWGTCVKCGAWLGVHGLEPDIELYVQHEVQIFRAVRRVLRKDGTLWLNLGDSYASGEIGRHDGITRNLTGMSAKFEGGERKQSRQETGLKPKDLVGIPWRVAFALQADGWYLRSDIIWAKPNPMPESVTDRPTKAHEYIFLLSKSARYFYDAEAIRETGSGLEWNSYKSTLNTGGNKGASTVPSGKKQSTYGALTFHEDENKTGRNRRTVWTIPTESYSGAHFATFPTALVEPCIKAGTSEHGVCSECGAPYTRVLEKHKPPKSLFTKRNAPDDGFVYDGVIVHGGWYGCGGSKLQVWLDEHPTKTLGWVAGCTCGGRVVPPVILDPFGGSGTVGQVAGALGRSWTLIEISEAYGRMAARRVLQPLARTTAEPPVDSLFEDL